MRKILHTSPLPLTMSIFGFQILVFIFIILGTWGAGGPIFGFLLPTIFIYEILCVIFLVLWLWYIASNLNQKLAARGIYYNLFYFRTFYITLVVCVVVLVSVIVFGILSGDELKHSLQGILRSETTSSYINFIQLTTPYLFSSCIFYLMLFLFVLDRNREAAVSEFIILFIFCLLLTYSFLLVPILFYYIQKKSLKYIES